MNPNSNQKRIAFGYMRNTIGKIVLYEGQAAAVKLIFMQYLDGRGLRGIKETLEVIGAPSPYNRRNWNPQAISNILSNPHYVGDDIYPQIITQEMFDDVQKIKAAKVTR